MAASRSRRLAVLVLVAASMMPLAARPAAAAEPYLVRDIVPGGPGVGIGSNPLLVPVGDRVFVFATEQDHGRETWITDGTAAGTRLVRDICPGPCSSEPATQGSLGERLLFSAISVPPDDDVPQVLQYRLWASDGTWLGTYGLGTGVVPARVSDEVPRSECSRIEGSSSSRCSTPGRRATSRVCG